MRSLVKRAQAGDKEAFVSLIETYKQDLYKIAISMLKNDADAADAIQDTVLSSYENLRGLREPKYFKTWLTRILTNHCNHILKERGRMTSLHEHMELESIPVETSGLEFLNLLNQLEEQYRIVLLLYFRGQRAKRKCRHFHLATAARVKYPAVCCGVFDYVEEFSVREIGAILEMNENTVKTRLSRGRKCFRKLYLEEHPEFVCEMEVKG